MSEISDLPSGVEWLHDQTSERLTWTSTDVTAKFFVPKAVKTAFINIVGNTSSTYSISYGSSGVASYTRIIPLRYPFYNNCYADELDMIGEGSSRLAADGHSIEYDFWIATIHFSTPKWRVDGPYPLVTESMDTARDMTTRPGTAYHFPSDGLVLPQNIGVPVPVTEFSLQFHQLASVNKALFASLAGCVNLSTFYDYAPGTVQYIGPATQGVMNSWGNTTWAVTHKFRWRAIPHNMVMRPDGAGFEAPVSLGTGDYLLPGGELNLLWAA